MFQKGFLYLPDPNPALKLRENRIPNIQPMENQTQMLNKEEDDVIRAAVPHFTITWVWRRGWQFHTRCLSVVGLGPIWERFFITGFVFFLYSIWFPRTRSKEFGLMWSLPNTHCEVSQVVLINPLLSVYYLHLYKLIWKYNKQYTMCPYGSMFTQQTGVSDPETNS